MNEAVPLGKEIFGLLEIDKIIQRLCTDKARDADRNLLRLAISDYQPSSGTVSSLLRTMESGGRIVEGAKDLFLSMVLERTEGKYKEAIVASARKGRRKTEGAPRTPKPKKDRPGTHELDGYRLQIKPTERQYAKRDGLYREEEVFADKIAAFHILTEGPFKTIPQVVAEIEKRGKDPKKGLQDLRAFFRGSYLPYGWVGEWNKDRTMIRIVPTSDWDGMNIPTGHAEYNINGRKRRKYKSQQDEQESAAA
jgi:hypothetical protein